MDQFISLLALPEHALFSTAGPLGNGDYHLIMSHAFWLSGAVANTGIRHTNVGGEFNLASPRCRAGVACLRERVADITHLRDVQHRSRGRSWRTSCRVMSVSQLVSVVRTWRICLCETRMPYYESARAAERP